jgi:hypothetical protein
MATSWPWDQHPTVIAPVDNVHHKVAVYHYRDYRGYVATIMTPCCERFFGVSECKSVTSARAALAAKVAAHTCS